MLLYAIIIKLNVGSINEDHDMHITYSTSIDLLCNLKRQLCNQCTSMQNHY